MSPAKRKSARSGRAATAAARAGKARGKARGSALTKAMKVKGKTPAKAGDHRVKGRIGAGVAAKNGAGVACDMPREQLEELLDRDEGRGDVLAHVPACHPCTTSLTVIAAQRDAIRHLAAEPGGTAVEWLLERGARAGEKKLADLVYELAKACLVVVKDIDRRVHLESRPRGHEAISLDVRGVARRLVYSAPSAEVARLPSNDPAGADAIAAADSCIAILEHLEGASERCRLARSVALICEDRPSDAEQILRQLLSRIGSGANRLHAHRNLQWALNRQRNYSVAIEHGRAAVREFPEDWQLTYNLAVSCASGGERKLFEQTARALRSLKPSLGADAAFRNGVLRFEAASFAEKLDTSVDAVLRVFGLASDIESVEVTSTR